MKAYYIYVIRSRSLQNALDTNFDLWFGFQIDPMFNMCTE